jgi:hypothetical protein
MSPKKTGATAPTKLDLRKQWKTLYNPPSKTAVIVEVPEFQYVMIAGAMEPGATPETSPSYTAALGALYGAAYTLKFMSKLRAMKPIDYTVMALEGQWWAEGALDYNNKDNWRWNMMIMQPDHIDAAMFAEAVTQLKAKKPNPANDQLRLERLHEGLCVQIMHIGPYSAEPPTIERMHAYAYDQGYKLRGLHHEIYLGDPRRTAPEKLKTVLRMPVERG